MLLLIKSAVAAPSWRASFWRQRPGWGGILVGELTKPNMEAGSTPSAHQLHFCQGRFGRVGCHRCQAKHKQTQAVRLKLPTLTHLHACAPHIKWTFSSHPFFNFCKLLKNLILHESDWRFYGCNKIGEPYSISWWFIWKWLPLLYCAWRDFGFPPMILMRYNDSYPQLRHCHHFHIHRLALGQYLVGCLKGKKKMELEKKKSFVYHAKSF